MSRSSAGDEISLDEDNYVYAEVSPRDGDSEESSRGSDDFVGGDGDLQTLMVSRFGFFCCHTVVLRVHNRDCVLLVA
eukprot:SAG31_NODE_31_length_32474_cov_18.308139_14_plen_77_part_00